MKYLSVCSGIEAASAAWHRLGWEPVAFSEIEPFPSAVLAHHYPNVPNWGDMTNFKEWPDATVDVLCGGTPCQSFSVAGLRKGLDDPRGDLMLTYLAIAGRYRPRWLVWENVPGVLSSGGGRDFGTFLGGLAQLGYGFAYRVLDAQYFGVAQRRRRVFVVGHLGDWRRAAAVLFERESLSGHPAPRREAGPAVAALTARGVGTCGADDNQGQAGHLIHCPDVSPAMKARDAKGPSSDGDGDGLPLVAHALRREGFDASEDGTGRGTPLVLVAIRTANTGANGHGVSSGVSHTRDGANGQAIAFDCKCTEVHYTEDGSHPTLRSMSSAGSPANAGGHAAVMTLAIRGRDGESTLEVREDGTSNAVLTPNGGRAGIGVGAIAKGMTVRRLTPRECERLQGFPDDYTLIPYRSRPAEKCPDGPRYKALGNSWAVPCARWIGERIDAVEAVCEEYKP